MDELKALHQLAMRGNMHDIRQKADYVGKLNECYVPFAQQAISALLKSFSHKQFWK
jgi:hypothetical protein